MVYAKNDMRFKIPTRWYWFKTFLPLVVVWLISFPLYAVDVDGDGLQDYQVSAGHNHTCAVGDNGVSCWGFNNNGETEVPTDLVNPVAISADRKSVV